MMVHAEQDHRRASKQREHPNRACHAGERGPTTSRSMLFQAPGPAKRPRPALLSRPRTMPSQVAVGPSFRPAVVRHEFDTWRAPHT